MVKLGQEPLQLQTYTRVRRQGERRGGEARVEGVGSKSQASKTLPRAVLRVWGAGCRHSKKGAIAGPRLKRARRTLLSVRSHIAALVSVQQ